MRIYNTTLFILFCLLFSMGNVTYAENTKTVAHSPSSSALRIVPVKTFAVPANRLLVSGTVTAYKSVVFAAQMPGRIVSIAGEEGDRFQAGQLLVKINDDELLAKRRTAWAQYATAATAVNNAGMQFQRQIVSPATSNRAPGGMGLPGMFDQIFTNPMSEMMGTRDYDIERSADVFASQSQLQQAHYSLEQARAQIQQIDTKLRDTQSIAPFAGVIVTKHIEVGDTVQPGQPLLVYENLDVLQIVADVPGRMIHNLKEGQLLHAKVDGLAHEVYVRVDKIFPTSDPVRHTTRVKLTLPDIKSIAPGNYAEVWIPVSQSVDKKRLLVPTTAVVERGGLPSVFVITAENRAELRLVRVGEQLASGDIVIQYGVKENEQILDKPPAFMTSDYDLAQQNKQ